MEGEGRVRAQSLSEGHTHEARVAADRSGAGKRSLKGASNTLTGLCVCRFRHLHFGLRVQGTLQEFQI